MQRSAAGHTGHLDDPAHRGAGVAVFLQAFQRGIEDAPAHGVAALGLGAARSLATGAWLGN